MRIYMLFQFQNGTIKATKCVSGLRALISFNSKMVQLKPLALSVSVANAQCFNSKMVQLKQYG